ncbi:uncharacterized protein LOC143035215 [Oratosquilla oratoria]|uniref:uncharacterized protein LOC143035215 n=1 Tax=Oratosquilla oratoria TaxID=337810 RepID=UPI003F76D8FA
MSPHRTIAPVTLSLVRIPGNGSDLSRPPLLLNLARTVQDNGGLLGHDLVVLAEGHASVRENFVPLRPFGGSPQGPGVRGTLRVIERVTEETRKTPKRTSEVSEESGPTKKRSYRPEEAAPLPQEHQGSHVSLVSDSPSADPPRSEKEPNQEPPSGNRSHPRFILKPKTAVYQLTKSIEEIRKKQEEDKMEKHKLQEEVELLNKKLAVFRGIFQDTAKLKAVINRLNIKI